MAIQFADILQDGDFPVRSVGVYTHFDNIVFYAERVKGLQPLTSMLPQVL
jgi:hypothetical protein